MGKAEKWTRQDERRYCLEREEAEEVLRVLECELPRLVFDDAQPATLISTVYFDSPGRDYFKRARARVNGSVKVRSREYLPLSGGTDRTVLGHSATCYLERKERNGTIRRKERVRLSKNELTDAIAGVAKLPEELELLRNEIQRFALEPTLISMYERQVWGFEGGLRITFDERVRYYAPPPELYREVNSLSPDELGEPTGHGPKRVLEVKYQAGDTLPSWLANLLASLPETMTFSKFLDGTEQLHKRPRFLPSLTRPISL